jgi:hypothetical protein
MYFILGAVYALAQQSKDDGCFKDLSLNQVAELMINELVSKR